MLLSPNSTPDPALEQLRPLLGVSELSLSWLAGDGSDRRYYRLSSSQWRDSRVLMQLGRADAQALVASRYDWVVMQRILAKHGLPVPSIIQSVPEVGALIIEDLGDTMLETKIQSLPSEEALSGAEYLWRQALEMLSRLLKIPRSADAVWCQRALDENRLLWELNFFREHFLAGPGGLKLSQDEWDIFSAESAALASFLGKGARFCTHRDFHSRNLLVTNAGLVVIDFQDMRLGPISYDLVSLCFDSYVHLHQEDRLKLLEIGLKELGNSLDKDTRAELAEQWRAQLLQRQLKALGSFAYLSIVKQRGNYLQYAPRALETLDPDLVGDSRWPFISGRLLKNLRAAAGV